MDSGYKMRGQSRYRVDLRAQVRALGSFSWKEASLVNLSKTGLCLATKQAFEIADEIEVEVATIDREGVSKQRRMTGKIQWKRGSRYGVRFTGGDKRKASKLSAAKSRHLKRV